MKQWLVSAGVAIVACIVALELAGVFYFYWTTGGLIYFNRGPVTAAPLLDRGPRHRLHPYFGFAGAYEQHVGSLYTNTLGFLQREQVTIPFAPGPNDIVVAVFGGSVAEKLVIGDAGGVPLRDALQARPLMAGKNVVLLSLAQGAAKQPQQLLTLAYLLALGQRIDLVLNIDGFNEFAMAAENHRMGLHPAFPAAQMMVPLTLELAGTPPSIRYYALAGRMLSSQAAAASSLESLRRARTGIGLVSTYGLLSWHRRAYSRATRAYSALVLNANSWEDLRERLSLDLPVRITDSQLFPALFDLWLRCSQQMRALTEAQNGRYLHVVQPNQYYSKHPFSKHEQQVALLPGPHSYRRGVELGYPLLAAGSAVLAANGIVSGIALFNNVPDEVYSDSCCHYTAKGETLFGAFVATQVEQRLNAER